MSPFEIKAKFKPAVAKRGSSGIIADGLEALGDNPFRVIIGITDSWGKGDNVSSSGAKLFIRQQDGDPVGRNWALARAAALLNEEDFDMVPYLWVVYGQQKRKWGRATTPATSVAQTQRVHEEMCLDPKWSMKPLPEQIQCLQVAYQAVLSKGILVGSFARSIWQAACYKVAKSATEQAVMEKPH